MYKYLRTPYSLSDEKIPKITVVHVQVVNVERCRLFSTVGRNDQNPRPLPIYKKEKKIFEKLDERVLFIPEIMINQLTGKILQYSYFQ